MNQGYFKDEYDSFVTEHHPLIYSFLHTRRLDENEYYDVIAFGFLKAADEYLSKPELRKRYKFSTVARVKMRDALYRYYKAQNCPMRKGITLSLDGAAYGDNEVLPLREILPAHDSLALDFETELLMLDLSSRVSASDMRIIRMKTDGYDVQEIAKSQKTTIKSVNELLNSLRDVVLSVCCG